MRHQLCNGCRTPIEQGFSDGKLLFCTQSCQQDFIQNGNQPVTGKRRPRQTSS